jgi:uncharacterized membrane protein required for colicin V production
MKVLIDLILIVTILVCAWAGYKKGLVLGVGTILAIIISIYMANLLSNTFSYEVIPALRPFISGYMEPKIEESVYTQLGFEQDENGNYNTDISSEDLITQNPDKVHDICKASFQALGIYEKTADVMASEAEETATDSGTSISDAIVLVMCEKITYYMGFLLAFIIIMIILTVLGNIFNLNFKLPAMNRINDIGGTILGVITGFLFCSVIVWAIKFAGIIIHEETISGTLFASLFLKMDIIAKWLGI